VIDVRPAFGPVWRRPTLDLWMRWTRRTARPSCVPRAVAQKHVTPVGGRERSSRQADFTGRKNAL